jgi:hypothetical protein
MMESDWKISFGGLSVKPAGELEDGERHDG